MATIDFFHGGVNTSGFGTMDVWASYKRDVNSKERPIHEAVADTNSGIKEEGGILEVVPSSTVRLPGAQGKTWVKRRASFPNGSYLIYRIKRMTSAGSFSQSMHSFVLSPRESAPLIELSISPPFQAGRSTLSVLYIVGRFDILKPEEVKEKKLHITAQGANDLETFDFAALNDFMELKILEKAERARIKPKIITGTKGKAITRVRRPRRLNL